jgi:hypothetical protein
MTGRIKLGVWLPFSADQENGPDAFIRRARVGPLRVIDRYAAGRGSMEDGCSAVGGCSVFAPACLLSDRGAMWPRRSAPIVRRHL